MHTFISKSKKLLIVLSILLIVANFFILSTTRELTRSYTNSQNQATWFLLQLSKQLSELTAITPYTLDGDAEHKKTWLKYELTWSRFDILLYNQESHGFMSLEGAHDFFEALFFRFQHLEEPFNNIKTQDDVLIISEQLNQIYADMIAYINKNYRLKNPIHKERMQQAQQIANIQYVLMLLLFSCIGLVSYIYYQESKHHKALAFTDTLTGISNRFSLFEALNHKQKNQPFSLFLLDLNGFKAVNDSFGHQAGDEALTQIAWRLSTMIPSSNYKVYRMGGDEFALILNSNSPVEIRKMHGFIEACFEEPIHLKGGYNTRLGCSVGTSIYPDDSKEINQLISIADHNMYQMKFADTDRPRTEQKR
ncbi:GGDEF domain-containing protein [Vibrio sp. YMD68]|uniref:GGDEF domain-containing protein n=1 Tax=Vibrio sp. YMD68 TaxID=3042300 RepID=UPI00249C63CD|nr:GGDEF domain-containing protein [Vibrio sp. YMD68]WGV98702.1 GGDEF domain-containing protein [Vibrio sp. YMD68]